MARRKGGSGHRPPRARQPPRRAPSPPRPAAPTPPPAPPPPPAPQPKPHPKPRPQPQPHLHQSRPWWLEPPLVSEPHSAAFLASPPALAFHTVCFPSPSTLLPRPRTLAHLAPSLSPRACPPRSLCAALLLDTAQLAASAPQPAPKTAQHSPTSTSASQVPATPTTTKQETKTAEEAVLPPLPWEPADLPHLATLARDRTLWDRGVSPCIPLLYVLRVLDAHPGACTPPVAARLLPLVSAAGAAPRAVPLLHAVLVRGGPVFFAPLLAFLRSSTIARASPAARRVAVAAVRDIALTATGADYAETVRTQAVAAIAKQLQILPMCDEMMLKTKEKEQEQVQGKRAQPPASTRKWNAFVVESLAALRGREAREKVRAAFAAGVVDERACGDYGTVAGALGDALPDPGVDALVAACRHCGRARAVCRRELRAQDAAAASAALQRGLELCRAQGTRQVRGEEAQEALRCFNQAVSCARLLSGSFDDCNARIYRAQRLAGLRRTQETFSDCAELLQTMHLKELWLRATAPFRTAAAASSASSTPGSLTASTVGTGASSTEAIASTLLAGDLLNFDAYVGGNNGSGANSFSPAPVAGCEDKQEERKEGAREMVAIALAVDWDRARTEAPIDVDVFQGYHNWREDDDDDDDDDEEELKEEEEEFNDECNGCGYGKRIAVGQEGLVAIRNEATVEVSHFASAGSTEKGSSTTPGDLQNGGKQRTVMLDAENCAQVATDVTGNVVAVLQGPTHAVSVWEFAGEPSVPPRFVPVGNPADELELLAVGGARGRLVAAAAGPKVLLWDWREPERTPGRGPHWLWGAGGRVTALAIDNESSIGSGSDCSGSSEGIKHTSVFAGVREETRVCVLEFDAGTQVLVRTLLGLTAHEADAGPFPKPACVTALACSRAHIAAGTDLGEVVVWSRRRGHVVHRLGAALSAPSREFYHAACAELPCLMAGCAARERRRRGLVHAAALAAAHGMLVAGLSNGQTAVISLCARRTVAVLSSSRDGGVRGYGSSGIGDKDDSDDEFEDKRKAIVGIAMTFTRTELTLRLADAGGRVATCRVPLDVVQAPGNAHILDSVLDQQLDPAHARCARAHAAAPQPRVCAACSRPCAEYIKCGRCLRTAYCSRACQNADWPRHKLSCEPHDI